MRKIDIIYLYEKAKREFDMACAVKVLAKQLHGLDLEIVQQNTGFREAFRRYIPKVVVLPFCYQERSHYLYLLKWRHAIYFNLTWEQFFYPGNRIAKTPRGDFALKHVIHHAWTKEYENYLRSIGVPDEHIFLNGNPALALYQMPYRSYYMRRTELAERYKLNLNKTWIFFPENYNWAFYGQEMLQQMINDGQSPQMVASLKEFSTTSFEEAMRWCGEMLKDCDVELIVRPRPSTESDEFARRVGLVLGGLPERMHIFKGETVREWILSSDLVVSSTSTSLIEAAIADKAIYILEPFESPEDLRQDWHKLVHKVRAYQEFVELCNNEPDVTSNIRLSEWARINMLSRGDPIKNIVNYLAEICESEKIKDRPRPSLRSITPPNKYFLPWWGAYLLRKLFLSIGLTKPSEKDYPEYKKDIILEEDAERRLKEWGDILSRRFQS